MDLFIGLGVIFFINVDLWRVKLNARRVTYCVL